jgi:hypothetical protein
MGPPWVGGDLKWEEGKGGWGADRLPSACKPTFLDGFGVRGC